MQRATNLQTSISNDESLYKYHAEEDSKDQETLLRNQLVAERRNFEENSFKALKILQQKDETIASLQKQLSNERAKHLAAKDALLQANTELNAKRSDVSISSSKVSHQELEQQNNKLILEAQQLRERCIDQSEQIQVLVYELSKLRDASPSPESSKEEIRRLQTELETLQKRIAVAPPSLQLREEWLTERAVEGGVSTSTPLNFAMSNTTANDSSHHSQQSGILQGKLIEAEVEIRRLTDILTELESSEFDLRDRLDESQRIISSMKMEEKEIATENEQLKQLVEVLESRVVESAQEIKSATPEPIVNSDMSHTWWKYVWHECQRLGREKRMALQQLNGDAPENDTMLTHQQQSEKMAESLRVQAVELITARQESLGQQLRHRQEVETLRNEADELRQECVQLKSKLRFQQKAKETKISEMAATIRSLSLRGALHTQLAECRQELEAERLVTSHLRFEMEEYRGLMEEEQRKVVVLRKENLSLQGTLDNLAVLRTVLSPSSLSVDGTYQSNSSPHALVSGPNPAALIEVMSGETRRLHRELEVKDMELIDCRKNLNDLEEVIEKYKQQILLSKPTLRFNGVRGFSDNFERVDGGVESKENFTKTNAHSSSIEQSNRDEAKQKHPNSRNPEASDGKIEDAFLLSYQPMSINVDRDATPKMVLESLDAVLLKDRIQLQDIIIADMRRQLLSARDNGSSDRLLSMSTEVLPEELAKFIREAEHEQSKMKEDNLVSLRLRSLLQVQLDEAKLDAINTKKENEELKQELYRTVAEQHRRDIPASSIALSNDFSEGETSACDATECQRIRNLLKERTAQLQVTIDTLDALNSADVETDKALPTRSNHQGIGPSYAEDLFNLASQPMASQDTSPAYRRQGPIHRNPSVWGYQLLVKRIVQLTAELCSQTAALHMAERRTGDLQSEGLEKAKMITAMKTQLKDQGTIVSKLKSKATELIDDTAFTQRDHMLKFSSLQSENKELVTALRELQAKYDTQEILFRQSKEALDSADDSNIEQWMSGMRESIVDAVVIRLSEKGNNGMDLFPSQEEKESDNNTTIKALLSKLIADLGHARAGRDDGGINNNNSQHFLQRITDMVLSCSNIATTASIQQRETENELRNSVVSQQANREIAKILAVRLLQTKRRASIGERAILNALTDTTLMSHKSALEGVLRNALNRARAERDNALVRWKSKSKKTQKSDGRANLEGTEALEGQIRLLQQQVAVAEQESRGSIALRAKEAALQSIDERFNFTEKNLQKWIRSELPRIVSGFPLTEDIMGDNEKSNGHVTEQLIAASGLDKAYALSQALSVARASQVVQEAKIATLEDKLSILRERNLELESVLLRWKDEINYSSVLSKSMKGDLPQGASSDDADGRVMTLEDILHGKYSNDANYNSQTRSGDSFIEAGPSSIEQVHNLSDRIAELEEESIRHKVEVAQLLAERNGLKEMVDVLLEDENSIKVKSTHQMTQIRSDLEVAHSQELLRLKQAYEQDRQLLLQELKDIGRAVEDAHVLTSSGGYGDSSNNSEADKSRVFNNSIQKHIEAIESEFSISRSAQSDTDTDNTIVIPTEHRPLTLSKPILYDKQTDTAYLVTFRSVAAEANLPPDSSTGQTGENEVKIDSRGNFDRDEDDTGSSDSIKDVYFDDLERLLAIEKRKNHEVRGEVTELETLLSIQKLAFEQHLDGMLPVADPRATRVELQVVDSYVQTDVLPRILSRTASTQTKNANDFIIDDHFHNENQDLWPSESDLLAEMLALLKTGHAHLMSGRNDHAIATIQAASAMGSRLKILLTKEQKALQPVGNDSYTSESTSFNLDLRNLNHRLESMVSNYRTLSQGEPKDGAHDTASEEKADAANANMKLQRRVSELENLLQAAHDGQVAMEEERERCISSLHHTYEKAISDSNAAMDATTAAAKEEIDRLQSCISQLRKQLLDLQTRSEAAEKRIAFDHSLHEQQRSGPHVGGGGDTTSGSSHSSESDAEVHSLIRNIRSRKTGKGNSTILHSKQVEDQNVEQLQDELARTAADLARSQELLQWANSNHSAELQSLKDQFFRFKSVQNDIVAALEKQLVDITVIHSMRGGSNSDEDLFIDSDDGIFGDDDKFSIHPLLSLQDAEEKIVKLAALYKLKKLELQTVLMSLNRFGEDSGNTITASVSAEEKEQAGRVAHGGLLDSSSASTLEYPNVVVQPLYPPLYRTLLSPRTQNPGTPERGRGRNVTLRPKSRSKSVDSGRNADLSTSRSQDLRPPRYSTRRKVDNSTEAVESREKELQYSQVRQEMLSARIAAAERRIDYLQRTLAHEKGISAQLRSHSQHLKQQLAQLQLQIERLKLSHTQKKEESFHAQPLPAPPSDENFETEQLIETVDQFLQALEAPFNTAIDPGDVGNSQRLLNRLQRLGQAADELRRDASHFTRSLLSHLQHWFKTAKNSNSDQNTNKVQTESATPFAAVTALKEELSRKSKLLAAIKAARAADVNALEQWKSESRKLDDNCKRLQRSLETKDNFLKDLKAKVAALEEKDKEKDSGGGASNADLTALSAAELRTRLKSSELERARGRNRLQVLKDKITELEGTVGALQSENERQKRAAAAVTELRLTLARKDDVIAGLRSQIERAQSELQQLKFLDAAQQAEGQKKIRQLQRQVDASRRDYEELDKEADLMRRRLVSGASAGQPNLSSAWTVQRSSQQPQPDLVPVSISLPPPHPVVVRASQSIHDPPSLPTQLDLSTAGNSVNSLSATTPLLGLGREASQDLQDVLASLNLNLDTQSNSNSSAYATGTYSSRSRSGGQRGAGIAGTDYRRTSFQDQILSDQDREGNNSDEDDEEDETSVEKRLKALVGAALRSPSQRRSSKNNPN